MTKKEQYDQMLLSIPIKLGKILAAFTTFIASLMPQLHVENNKKDLYPRRFTPKTKVFSATIRSPPAPCFPSFQQAWAESLP
jgi:hypothetical protein